MSILESFKRVLTIEAAAIQAFADQADDHINTVVERLLACQGRVVVIGMGKCGHVARKIAATLASTGTPSAWVHPAEALHGDLGFIDARRDIALVLSKSGETAEITALLPHLHRAGVSIIALTSGPQSTLARYAEEVVTLPVPEEADPINMAPTTSSTLMLAVGDALAAVLMEQRSFGKEDYARLHPGGSLGQKLLCTVAELMHAGENMPLIHESASLRDTLVEMTSKRLGAVIAINDVFEMTGILTDGDIRRIFQREQQPLDNPLCTMMTRRPKNITADALAIDALRHMEANLITVLPVLDEGFRPVGVIHIHDILRAGIV